MRSERRLLITITLLCLVGACRTVGKQSPDSAPTVGAIEKPVYRSPKPELGIHPPARPRTCGQFGKPWVVAGAPRIHNVAPEDAQRVTTLMRQYATMPLMDIRARNGLVEAYSGCCSGVPDDCSMFIVRFDKQPDGEWSVVGTSEAVP
jgi:hypothetical protein